MPVLLVLLVQTALLVPPDHPVPEDLMVQMVHLEIQVLRDLLAHLDQLV